MNRLDNPYCLHVGEIGRILDGRLSNGKMGPRLRKRYARIRAKWIVFILGEITGNELEVWPV